LAQNKAGRPDCLVSLPANSDQFCHLVTIFGSMDKPGNAYRKGRLSTVDMQSKLTIYKTSYLNVVNHTEPSPQNILDEIWGRVFNSGSGCMNKKHFCCYETKLSSLKLVLNLSYFFSLQ
jgi:hypothetical protein